MNVSSYLFLQTSDGIIQYPNDYTKTIFQNAVGTYRSKKRIVYYRQGNVMYHIYIRKISSVDFCGIAFATNNVVCINVDELYSIFEEAFARIVYNANVFKFTEEGLLSVDDKTQVNDLLLNVRLANFVSSETERIKSSFEKLPAENYENSKDFVKRLNEKSFTQKAFVDALQEYSSVFVEKYASTEDILSILKTGNQLHALNTEKKNLLNQNAKLQQEFDKLENEKKRSTIVSWLDSCLSSCLFYLMLGVVLFFYFNSKIDNEIAELENEITIKENEIADLNREKQNEININNALRNENEDLRNQKDSLEQIIVSNDSWKIEMTDEDGRIIKEYKEGNWAIRKETLYYINFTIYGKTIKKEIFAW